MQEYDPFIPLGKAVVVCNRAVLAAFASLEILWGIRYEAAPTLIGRLAEIQETRID